MRGFTAFKIVYAFKKHRNECWKLKQCTLQNNRLQKKKAKEGHLNSTMLVKKTIRNFRAELFERISQFTAKFQHQKYAMKFDCSETRIRSLYHKGGFSHLSKELDQRKGAHDKCLSRIGNSSLALSEEDRNALEKSRTFVSRVRYKASISPKHFRSLRQNIC